MSKKNINGCKKILKLMGISDWIATKKWYNFTVNNNDFYAMLQRRLQYKTPEELAFFFQT